MKKLLFFLGLSACGPETCHERTYSRAEDDASAITKTETFCREIRGYNRSAFICYARNGSTVYCPEDTGLFCFPVVIVPEGKTTEPWPPLKKPEQVKAEMDALVPVAQ